MFDRFFVRLIGLVAVLLVALGGLSLLINFAPSVASALSWLIAIAASAAAVFFTLVSIAVAAKSPPLQPVAEVSILGKHTVGLSKLLIGLLAFFGNMALTWLIALSVSFQKAPDVDFTSITSQLWGLFLTIAGSVAYVYWMWIAVDLLRARQAGRLRTVGQIEETWLARLDAPRAARLLARMAAWLMRSPWFLFLYTFFAAPAVIYSIGQWAFAMITSR